MNVYSDTMHVLQINNNFMQDHTAQVELLTLMYH